MNEKNIFEQAVRNKYRFPFRGLCTVEDLWDLSVANLDTVYKELNKQKKQSEEDSLLESKTSEDVRLDNMIEIVKHIVSTKQNEQAEKLLAKEKKEKDKFIMDLIKRKQNERLENMTIEELTKMLDE